MASNVITPLKSTLEKAVNNNTGTLKNVFSTLLVIGLEALLSSNKNFFKCPTQGHFTYGCVFIFVPALLAFLIMFYLSNSFKKESQGCCIAEVDDKRKCCHYSYPKLRCNVEMMKAFMYGLVAGCLWIVWALLQKKYYTCAVFGSEDQLKNVTGKNKTILEELYQRAQVESEIIGFAILPLVMGIPMLILSLRRCFCLRDRFSILKLSEYEKLVAQAVEEKFTEEIKEFATKQAESIVKSFFSQNSKAVKSTAEVISEVHDELSKIEGYTEAVKSIGENLEAKVFAEKFKKKIEDLAEKEITSAFEDKGGRQKYEDIKNLLESIIREYPRLSGSGDYRQPYKKKNEAEIGDATEMSAL